MRRYKITGSAGTYRDGDTIKDKYEEIDYEILAPPAFIGLLQRLSGGFDGGIRVQEVCQPSRFIDEMGEENVTKVTVKDDTDGDIPY